MCRAHQGLGGSLVNRYVRAAGGQQHPPGVGGAHIHGTVAEHRGDRVHRQLWASQGQQDGGRVVDAGVGVDNNSLQFATWSLAEKMPRIIPLLI